jgi:hypothetical protein
VGGSVCGRRQRTKNSRLTGEAGQPCCAWNHDFNKSIGSFLTRVQVSNSNDPARMLKRGVGNSGGREGGCIFTIAEEEGGRTRAVELVPQGSHTVRRRRGQVDRL